ncbi:hypothetical protein BDY19DRAFT_1089893 [Irpex rosettiformis]|uniref:Uncharacterized protein n=1 Tax=Irpex rosettiformis TaxID=378272 RepID=A0ACB8U3C6_9APHY|nr:hypothetical protein BDY19DRAFT_1089893 [Irpex rosettiformis]
MLWLSRLSKAFNKFFTSRTTQFIWKAAALNVPDLPPRPEELTEIAYSSLLFDTHCHNCYSKNCYNVYWSCRIRLCKKCYGDLAVSSRDYYNSLLPHSSKAVKELLYTYHFSVNELVPPLAKHNNGAITQYRPFLDKFLLAWKELSDSEEKQKKKEFLIEHHNSTTAIMKTVPPLEDWYDRCRSTRADELHDVRQARQDAIMEKLKEDGWQIELDYLEASKDDKKKFFKLPEIRKTQALSPRIWATIKDSVADFMQEIRDKRLHEIYMATLQSRVEELGKVIAAIAPDICKYRLTPPECELCIPEIFAMVDPKKEDFNVEDLRPALRTLMIDYLGKRDGYAQQELMTALRKEFGLSDAIDPFWLAVGSHFRCAQCNRVYGLGMAVRHNCQHSWDYPLNKPEWMSDDYFAVIREYIKKSSYYGNGPQFMWLVENFRATFAHAAATIEDCGFDVKTATVKDLDEDKNLRLLCTNHKTRKGDKIEYAPIMKWRTAAFAKHCCNSYYKPNARPAYKRATEKQVAAVKESEEACAAEAALLKNEEHGDNDYFCVRCPERFETVGHATYHVKEKHGIAEPGKNDWTIFHLDMRLPKCVYLVPQQVRKGQHHTLVNLIKNKHISITIYRWENW